LSIVVNGVPRDGRDGESLADLVADSGAPTTGVAVAVNGEVVPRTDWPLRALRPGDRVEIVTAVQGG
jgi:sulfur carrier protein